MQLGDGLKEIHVQVRDGEFEQAVSRLKSIISGISSEYGERLHRYSPKVVERKRSDLRRRIAALLDPLFRSFCTELENQATGIFEHDLGSAAKDKFTNSKLSDAVQRALVFYRAAIQG